jgi:hypothetical protein
MHGVTIPQDKNVMTPADAIQNKPELCKQGLYLTLRPTFRVISKFSPQFIAPGHLLRPLATP